MTLASPAVSVIVPCYGQARFLPQSVGSVLAQTFGDLECIIIDDGSPDDTSAVARALAASDSRVRYVKQENRGLAGARNCGIRVATGEFLQFLDADDLLCPGKLEMQVKILNARADISGVFCDFAYFESSSPEVLTASRPSFRKRYANPDLWAALLEGNFIVVHAPLVRRSAVRSLGGFDESLRACEDYDLWLRLVGSGQRLLFQDAVLALYRKHPASMSRNLVSQWRGELGALSKIAHYARLAPDHREIYRRHQVSLRRNLARELLRRGSVAEAIAVSTSIRHIGFKRSLRNLLEISGSAANAAYGRSIGWRLTRDR